MEEEGDEMMERIHNRHLIRTAQEHLRLSADNEHFEFDSAFPEGRNLKIDFFKCKSTCNSVRIFPGLSQDPRLRGIEEDGTTDGGQLGGQLGGQPVVAAANNQNNNSNNNNNENKGERRRLDFVCDGRRGKRGGEASGREPKNEILSRTLCRITRRILIRISFYVIFVWFVLSADFPGVESVPVKATETRLINLNKESTNNSRTFRIYGDGIGLSYPPEGGNEEIRGENRWQDGRMRKYHRVQQQQQQQQQKGQQRRHHNHQNHRHHRHENTVNKNCKEYDVTSRAFLSDFVFEGTARSRSGRNSGRYVTFVVQRILKQKSNLLRTKTQIRLLFSAKSQRLSRIDPIRDCPVNSITNGHRAVANLKIGDNYYVFADQSGLFNYTARGEPIVVNRRNLKSIRSVLSKKKERPPRIRGLKDANLQTGQPLRLNCQIRGSPVPRINWYKDGASLIPSPRVNVTYYRRNSTVEIKSSELDDGGFYECRATSVTGKIAKISAHVNVWKLYTPSTADPEKSFPTKKCATDAYCLNGGQCYFIEHLGEHMCECKAGFKGARCDMKEVSFLGIKSYFCGFNIGYSSYYC